MKVICIDLFSKVFSGQLTNGKIYDVVGKDNFNQYCIKDDTGNIRWYNSNRFISIEEERDRKLKLLGI